MPHQSHHSTKSLTDWRNVYLISFFATADALQFTFFTWSFYHFVQQLDPTASSSFVGIILAASGVGEAVSAPFFGWWANKQGLVLPPLGASILCSVVANLTYPMLNALPHGWNTVGLLMSRFLSGAGSGNRGVFFAYISAVSEPEDRTRVMALAGGGALVGLTVGPAVQMAFTWIGAEGVTLLGFIRISMYTAPALLALLINVICWAALVFYLDDGLDRQRQIFENVEDDAASVNSEDGETEARMETRCSNKGVESYANFSSSELRMDVIAVSVCMATRAIRMLITSNIESTGAPFSALMFGFSPAQVLTYNSASQAALGVVTTAMFIVYAATPYTKWVSERVNCVGAMVALLIFHIVTFAWPFLPNHAHCAVFDGANSSLTNWCDDLTAINPYLFYVLYVVIFGIALPCLNNSLQSLYSLVLGGGRQGLMQGINQAVGCVSRILGPLIMSSAFAHFGPRATWAIEISLLFLTLIVWAAVYRRLIPAAKRAEMKMRKIPSATTVFTVDKNTGETKH